MFTPFEAISPQAKVWIYQSNRLLIDNEVHEINQSIKEFINTWTAHQQEVKGYGEVMYNRFIVLFADSFTSGCSIDTSVHFIKKIGSQYNIDFFDRLSIAYLKENGKETELFRLKELLSLYDNKILNDNTLIFDNLVGNKTDFLNNWIVKLSNSYLNYKFRATSI